MAHILLVLFHVFSMLNYKKEHKKTYKKTNRTKQKKKQKKKKLLNRHCLFFEQCQVASLDKSVSNSF